MAGIKALRKIQLGLESTAGDAVVATAIWRGQGTIQDDRVVTFVQEDVGILGGLDRTYTPKLGASISFDATEATFEQLGYVLNAGVVGSTGVQDGAGTDYIYTYLFPSDAVTVPYYYTIEGGDNTEAEEMEYSFVSDWSLSGAAGEAWMVTANWIGRQCSTSTFTGSIAIPAVDEMLFSKSKLYIDPSTDAYGTAIKSNLLLAATLNVTSGFIPVWAADGALYFSFVKQVAPEVTLEVTFEYDANAVAEIAAWRAETARKIKLLVEGPAVTTGGTTYSVKTFIANLPGKWERFDKIGEQDGNDIVTGLFRVRALQSASTDCGTLILVNELTALP